MGSPVVPHNKMNFKFLLAVFVVAVALMPTAHSQRLAGQVSSLHKERLKELSGFQNSSCGSSEEIEKQLSRIEETLDDWEVAKLSVLLDVAGNECSANCSEDSDNDEQCLACVKERVDPIVFAQSFKCILCFAKLSRPAYTCYRQHRVSLATVRCIFNAAKGIKSCGKCARKKICGLLKKINSKLGALCCQVTGCSSSEMLEGGQ